MASLRGSTAENTTAMNVSIENHQIILSKDNYHTLLHVCLAAVLGVKNTADAVSQLDNLLYINLRFIQLIIDC